MDYGFNTKQMSLLFGRGVQPSLCSSDWKEPSAVVCEIGDKGIGHAFKRKKEMNGESE